MKDFDMEVRVPMRNGMSIAVPFYFKQEPNQGSILSEDETFSLIADRIGYDIINVLNLPFDEINNHGSEVYSQFVKFKSCAFDQIAAHYATLGIE